MLICYVCSREPASVTAPVPDEYDLVPDEGIPETPIVEGMSYLLKLGVHYYKTIDLSKKLSESEIGKVPSHCSHMFGCLENKCAMPALFLQIESRIFQVWYEFLRLDVENERMGVHINLHARFERLKDKLQKTKEDVEELCKI